MKKPLAFALLLCLLVPSAAFSEEPVVSPSPEAMPVAPPPPPPPVVEPLASAAAVAAPVMETPADVLAIEPVGENLEFISGEISAVDEAAKTITVKLYGEGEDAANDKILTISLDETTDITDGENDRDLKSLTSGTEVDVEYDSSSNKATYIFVY